MGKLAIMSDLHVDINKLEQQEINQLITILKKQRITHLHLAGDTANTVERLIETVQQIEQSGIPVTFNFGNHELPHLKSNNEMENYSDPHFLNNAFINLNDQLVLLSFNGWYDYSFALEQDFSKITTAKNLYWYDRVINRYASDPEVLTTILEKLSMTLDELKKRNKQVIIATHFVPKQEFIRYFTGEYERWNQINAFLGSKVTGELFEKYNNIQHVVFGHTHRRFTDQTIHNIVYSARPFGYFYEWRLTKNFMLENNLMTVFNPYKVRRILRNHQEHFSDYRLKHLQEEFSQAITIIDY